MPDTPMAAAPISKLVTLIITTSPTPSAPSTELIEAIISSFRNHCLDLLSCRVILVLDTYDRVGPEARLKKGQVTVKGASEVDLYKSNVKSLILKEYYREDENNILIQHPDAEAEYGSPCIATNFVPYSTTQTEDKRVTFIEPARRLGFGLAVRSALRVTETPYVWVHQHDWPLVSVVPLRSILEVMQNSEGDDNMPVKYVCLPSVRMLSYAVSPHVLQFPALRNLTTSLKRNFTPPSEPGDGIPLTPLFFWHDKPHIASTAHYLSRVFPTRLAMMRGAFIEDTIGHRAREQMKEGNWAKWACWLYYPNEGRQPCLRHLHGRKWRGTEAEMIKKALWMESQMKEGDIAID
ncbi:hypothetical protein F5X99DRAFT_171568 [Biscogniauxia marginata]|nr:hypothetical protein F5X99DRAFT_171568 [Biscogniauxia marginata]